MAGARLRAGGRSTPCAKQKAFVTVRASAPSPEFYWAPKKPHVSVGGFFGARGKAERRDGKAGYFLIFALRGGFCRETVASIPGQSRSKPAEAAGVMGRANIGRGVFPGDIEIGACRRSSILGHLKGRSLIREYRFAPSSSAQRQRVVGGDASGASPRTAAMYHLVLNPKERSTRLVSCIRGLLRNVERGCRARLLQRAGRYRLAGSSAKSMGIKGKGTLSSVTLGAPPPKPPGLKALIRTPGGESEKAKRDGSEGSAARFQSPGLAIECCWRGDSMSLRRHFG